MIGRMAHRVTLQEPDTTEETGFRDVGTVFAAIETAGAGSRPIDAGGPAAIGSKRVRMHYRADVRAGWRLLENEQTYQVTGTGDPDGHRRELLVLCTEVQ